MGFFSKDYQLEIVHDITHIHVQKKIIYILVKVRNKSFIKIYF